MLFVDDNVNLSKSMFFILKKKGYEVDLANNGLLALELINQKKYDIIFLDIKMPDLNRVETFKRIKKNASDTIVMMMMMTAYTVEELVREALEEGAYGIIYKPFNLDQITNLIQEAISKKGGSLILIVDDNPSTRKLLQKILRKKNYKVGICKDGDEAIQVCKENCFDVLLIDIKLSTNNGLENYLTIKQIRPDVVAIMMIGYRQEVSEIVNQALQASAYACLYKPIAVSDMLQIIEEALRMREKDANYK